MSTRSMQTIRLMKFVEAMKKGRYPNVPDMVRMLRDADIDEGLPIQCEERTVRRDIKVLRDDYHAPIAFNRKQQGFYLTDPTWQFSPPATPHDDQRVKACVDPKTMRIVREAHRTCHVLKFSYHEPHREPVEHLFEPYVVVLYNGIWYIRGKDHRTKEVQTFQPHRIKNASLEKQVFRPDQKVIVETRKKGPACEEKISGARFHVKADAAFFFEERATGEGYKIARQADGSLIVDVPPLILGDLLYFVLSGRGYIRLLEPADLRPLVIECAQEVIAANGEVADG